MGNVISTNAAYPAGVNSFATASAIPSNFSGIARVGTKIVAGDGASLSIPLTNVASHCCINTSKEATNIEFMSRSHHIAMDDISSLQILVQNWIVSTATSFIESGLGGDLTLTASVEYPVGTFTRITFDGAIAGTVPDGMNKLSDIVEVVIPKGAEFYIRQWRRNPAGALYSTNCSTKSTATFGLAGSQTDLTMGGTVNPTGSISVATPAIIARSTIKSVLCLGDSIAAGSGDAAGAANNPKGYFGVLSRPVGPYFAACNGGVSGDKLSAIISSNSKRLEIAQYYTHILSNFGVNDISASATSTTMLANYATLAALFPGKKFFQSTITSKTDAGNTALANATQDAQRVLVNTGLRTSYIKGIVGILDYEAVLTDQTTKLWVNSAYTTDGLHPNVSGYAAVEANHKYPLWAF